MKAEVTTYWTAEKQMRGEGWKWGNCRTSDKGNRNQRGEMGETIGSEEDRASKAKGKQEAVRATKLYFIFPCRTLLLPLPGNSNTALSERFPIFKCYLIPMLQL